MSAFTARWLRNSKDISLQKNRVAVSKVFDSPEPGDILKMKTCTIIEERGKDFLESTYAVKRGSKTRMCFLYLGNVAEASHATKEEMEKRLNLLGWKYTPDSKET